MTTDPSAGVARLVRRTPADPADVPDGRLLDRFARHADQAAFAALVRRHGPMVLGVCRRALGNAADADDAFQATFLVLARKAGELAARPAVGNWLYGVAVHTALKAKAMAARRRRHERASGGAYPRRLPDPDPDLREAFDRELAALPEKYREPLVLHELEGLPRKVVAARLGIPDGTLSSRLATAKRLLAARLARAGLPAAAVATLGESGRAAVPPALADAAVAAAGGGAGTTVLELAREVSVMFLVKKLKVGAAAGAVAAAVGLLALAAAPRTAAEPPPKPASEQVADPVFKKLYKEEEDAVAALRGTWELESQTTNGGAVPDDRGAKPAFLTFADRRAVWEQPANDRHRDIRHRLWYTVNPRATPAELNAYGDGMLMLCRYKLDGDKLTLAMFGRSEAERPVGFTRAENKSPLPLVVHVYRRVKDPKTPGAVLERFQGKWEIVSLTADGKDALTDTTDRSVVIDWDRLQTDKTDCTVKLDPAAVPAAVDLVPPPSRANDKVVRGIYTFDGDTLKMCVSEDARPRPTKFDASAGSGQRVLVLKRAKK